MSFPTCRIAGCSGSGALDGLCLTHEIHRLCAEVADLGRKATASATDHAAEVASLRERLAEAERERDKAITDRNLWFDRAAARHNSMEVHRTYAAKMEEERNEALAQRLAAERALEEVREALRHQTMRTHHYHPAGCSACDAAAAALSGGGT